MAVFWGWGMVVLIYLFIFLNFNPAFNETLVKMKMEPSTCTCDYSGGLLYKIYAEICFLFLPPIQLNHYYIIYIVGF